LHSIPSVPPATHILRNTNESQLIRTSTKRLSVAEEMFFASVRSYSNEVLARLNHSQSSDPNITRPIGGVKPYLDRQDSGASNCSPRSLSEYIMISYQGISLRERRPGVAERQNFALAEDSALSLRALLQLDKDMKYS
jgi:hypothetical protein